MAIDAEIQKIIGHDYQDEEKEKAMALLGSIQPEHVMPGSAKNLLNTRFAVLKLAKGDIKELKLYTEKAKVDFKDIMYWASLRSTGK